MNITIETKDPKQIVDITDDVQAALKNAKEGVAIVSVQHTTCAITTADLDPGTDKDFLDFLQGIVPGIRWRHPHDPSHAPDHLLSALIGPSVAVPIESGQLKLGTWQRIILVELDGPRKRGLTINLLAEK